MVDFGISAVEGNTIVHMNSHELSYNNCNPNTNVNETSILRELLGKDAANKEGIVDKIGRKHLSLETSKLSQSAANAYEKGYLKGMSSKSTSKRKRNASGRIPELRASPISNGSNKSPILSKEMVQALQNNTL